MEKDLNYVLNNVLSSYPLGDLVKCQITSHLDGVLALAGSHTLLPPPLGVLPPDSCDGVMPE